MFNFRSFAIAAVGAVALTAASAQAGEPQVLKLTQIGCQFVESENGVNHGYQPKSAADCKKINKETGKDRLTKAKEIVVKPGKYVIRVTNKNVPYALGFWIRSEGYDWKNPLHKVSKLSVSGGGLTLGKSRDYEVELKPGRYTYSCPLNPTPDYTLVVKG
ncbi:MAG TPA: hypothetical protein DCS82_02945 [Rhodospirillaceae bacterium]|nr:hypothetical protein [Rhodospirillaceae bacterium]HAA91953.1 hypothetical protein [Rhodospirillaceae bacterium]HAT34648.1 hypothetical protein [Rhodospirillaceae bacterium]|tara:strand:+ start:57 stop:536 length:480 start_codon:yes stop_codon:yes gene_type:complete